MADLKLTDFDPMLTASTAVANESFNKSTDDIVVVVEDEEGDMHTIVDVKYNPMSGAIHIKFNRDNDE